MFELLKADFRKAKEQYKQFKSIANDPNIQYMKYNERFIYHRFRDYVHNLFEMGEEILFDTILLEKECPLYIAFTTERIYILHQRTFNKNDIVEGYYDYISFTNVVVQKKRGEYDILRFNMVNQHYRKPYKVKVYTEVVHEVVKHLNMSEAPIGL